MRKVQTPPTRIRYQVSSVQDTVPKIRLNDTDEAILDEIRENGRATTTLLADAVGVSRTYTGDRVRRLLEHEYLEEVAPNLYDIADKGADKLDDGDK